MAKVKRLVYGILFLVMLIPLFSVAKVSAYQPYDGSVGQPYYYRYRVTAKTSTKHESGSEQGEVKARFYFKNVATNTTSYEDAEFKGEGINNKGKFMTAETGYIRYDPWTICEVRMFNNGGNAYRVRYMDDLIVAVFDHDYRCIGEYAYQDWNCYFYDGEGSGDSQGKWIENDSKHAWSVTMDVNFSGNGVQTFNPTKLNWKQFSNSIYLDVSDERGSEKVYWDYEPLEGSRWATLRSDGYGIPEVWNYDNAWPTLSFSSVGNANVNGGSAATWDNLTGDVSGKAIKVEKDNKDRVRGFSIDRKKLASFMNKNCINKIEITTTANFNWYLFSDSRLDLEGAKNHGSDKFTRTYTIWRKALEIESVTWSSGMPGSSEEIIGTGGIIKDPVITSDDGLFYHSEDNYYYNSKSNAIVATIKFKNTDHYNYVNTIIKRGDIILNPPKIRIGDTGIEEWCDYLWFKNGGKITWDRFNGVRWRASDDCTIKFWFPLSGKEIDSEDKHISLVFDDFAIGEYKLTTAGKDHFADGSQGGDLVYDQTTHKVDTVKPEYTVEFTDDKEVNGWRKVANLKITPSENIHSSMTQGNKKKETNNTMLYYLWNNAYVPISKPSGEHSKASNLQHTIGVAKGSETLMTVELSGIQKEIEAPLITTARDIAGNNFDSDLYTFYRGDFAKLKLDSLAPRAFVSSGKEVYNDIDGSKTLEYTFKLQDATKSGKVYYSFTTTPSHPAINEAGSDSGEGTKPINSLLGRWLFLDQQYTDATDYNSIDNTNGTALVKVNPGETFTGYLHYYTKDALGNTSDVTTLDVKLENPDVDCVITADEDTVTPKRNYTINISSDKGEIYWRWYSETYGGYINHYAPYTSAEETGKGLQNEHNGHTEMLDGKCTLWVEVRIGQNIRRFSRDFVFDNAQPEIGFVNVGGSAYKTSHTINVQATDPSGIVSAKVYLINSQSKVEESIDGLELVPNNDKIIDSDVVVSGVKSGAYRLKVSAIDSNGFEMLKESNTFYIRNAPVDTQITLSNVTTIDGKFYTSENKYTLTIDAKEAFEGTEDGQYLHYRLTTDSNKWGAWSVMDEPMEVSGDGYSTSLVLETPIVLTEGENSIYVETLVASKGANAQNLRENADTDVVVVTLDTLAPTAALELSDTHTQNVIYGKLTLTDALYGFTIDTNGLSEDVLEITEGENGEYILKVHGNIDDSIFASDALGNTLEIPIKITNHDTLAPTVTSQEPVLIQNGERVDVTMMFTVTDAEQFGGVRIALIPESKLDKAVDSDGKILEKYFADGDQSEIPGGFEYNVVSQSLGKYKNEVNLTYEVRLGGITGDYYLGVRAVDSLGNTADTVIEYPLSPVDAPAEITGDITVSPKNANVVARVNVSFNTPVYVLPSNLVTDKANSNEGLTLDETNLSLAERNATAYSLTQSFSITRTGKHKLYVVDAIGRSSVVNVNITDDMVSFGNSDVLTARTVSIHGYETFSYEDRQHHFEFAEDPELAYREITGDELVYAGYEFVDYDSGSDLMRFTAIEVVAPTGGSVILGREYSEYAYEDPEGIAFWKNLSERYFVDPEAPEKGYTKLYFKVEQKYKEEITSMFDSMEFNSTERNVEVKYRAEGDAEDAWTYAVLTVGNIENTGPLVETTITPETVRGEDENTGERIPLYYTSEDVVLTAKMADPDSGLMYLELYGRDIVPDETEYLPVLIDEKIYFDDIKYPYTYEHERFTLTIEGPADQNGNQLSDKDYKILTIVFHDNILLSVTPCNNFEMGSMLQNMMDGGLAIDYINKDIISDGDYTVEYLYEDYNGDWNTVQDGEYYKNVKAVIDFTDEGLERNIIITNNSGSNEKFFSNNDRSFTFELSDKFGFTHSVPVSFTLFDEVPGTLDYTLSTLEKTNKPVTVTITAKDEQSGIGSVKIEKVSQASSAPLNITTVGAGVYEAKVQSSGNYIITLTDMVGNVTQKSFVITNIDTTVPDVVEVSYNVEDGKKTSGNVVATLHYSKSGVKITKVTSASGILVKHYDVDRNASVIRFFENGSVNVWFADEHGNENVTVVSADQIYRNPPALEAVSTVSEDGRYVTIGFKKALDASTGRPIDIYRELYDLNIRYHGIVLRGERYVTDDGGNVIDIIPAEFVFTQNGTYTFDVYDDEGIASHITVEIVDIDKRAPKITQVSWSYVYDAYEGGEWVQKPVTDSWTVGNEDGYVIDTDVYHVTKNDVDVTITTDEETTIKGDSTSELGTEHTLKYNENGMYQFNAEKPNGVFDSYGFQVEIIDKEPPVLTLANTELVFYENDAANVKPYSIDILNEAGVAFDAYDIFKGKTDLNDKVQIDYGEFDPYNFKDNVFDRTKPYYITYTVYDEAGNKTETVLTLRLVGENDAVVLVNGRFPDFAGRMQLIGTDEIKLNIGNFSGTSYARVMQGTYSMGNMKTKGEMLTETRPGSGEYVYKVEKGNWYTFLVQTDKRDYFHIQVFVTE